VFKLAIDKLTGRLTDCGSAQQLVTPRRVPDALYGELVETVGGGEYSEVRAREVERVSHCRAVRVLRIRIL